MELESSILAARRCLLTFGGIGAFWPLSDLILDDQQGQIYDQATFRPISIILIAVCCAAIDGA